MYKFVLNSKYIFIVFCAPLSCQNGRAEGRVTKKNDLVVAFSRKNPPINHTSVHFQEDSSGIYCIQYLRNVFTGGRYLEYIGDQKVVYWNQ